MALSSNSVIHLTHKKESLIGILQDNFKIFFSLEQLQTSSGNYTITIPMVSFCDIPLSEIKNHIMSYGEYGIGLKKSWATKKKLNPVLYIEKESRLGADIHTTMKELLSGKFLKDLDDNECTLLDILRHIKNYQGDLKRKGTVISDYRFSDEREWRFVPDKSEGKMVVKQANFKTQDQKDSANKHFEQLRLKFTPDDINYIIIKEEEEIPEFIDVLRKAKGNRYSVQQVERLMTRILTIDQIMTDI